jgi:hypothetical protein
MNTKDIFIRAGKTFVQAAVPVWMSIDITQPGVADVWSQAVQTGLVAGAAAVLALIWNAALQWSNENVQPDKGKR